MANSEPIGGVRRAERWLGNFIQITTFVAIPVGCTAVAYAASTDIDGYTRSEAIRNALLVDLGIAVGTVFLVLPAMVARDILGYLRHIAAHASTVARSDMFGK